MTRMPTIFSCGTSGFAAAGAAAAGVGTGEGAAVGDFAWAAAKEARRSPPASKTPKGRRMAAASRACPAPMAGAGWEFTGKSTSCWGLERRGGLLLFPKSVSVPASSAPAGRRRGTPLPLGNRFGLPSGYGQALGTDPDLDRLDAVVPRRDEDLRNRVLDVLLDGAAKGSRTHVRVVAALAQQPLDRGVVHVHRGALG